MSCEHLDTCVLKHRCPQGVAGCWPSAMMVNARPYALVTHRAVEVELSSGVKRRHTAILRGRCTKLLLLDACRKLCYRVNRTVVQ